MIEMDKQYVLASNGQPVRVLCVDRPIENYPVIAMTGSGNLVALSSEGSLYTNGVFSPYIKEYDPLEEVKNLPVDAPIWVRSAAGWVPRHFSHVEGAYVCTWRNGCTSHTSTKTNSWAQWSINKPKELV